MDTNIQRALNDKLYDKRKVGALEYGTAPAQLLMHHQTYCLLSLYNLDLRR
jgi:hypothetical protein